MKQLYLTSQKIDCEQLSKFRTGSLATQKDRPNTLLYVPLDFELEKHSHLKH